MSLNFSSTLSKNINNLIKTIEKAEKKAIKAGLRAGIKEYKAIAKPLIPVLGKSTPYRQKGTLQRNLKAVVKKPRNGKNEASLFFPSMGNKYFKGTQVLLPRQRKKMTQTGKLLTGPVVTYKNDPFYWAAVSKGGGRMKGTRFMEKAKQAGESKALATAKAVMIATYQAEMRKAGF